MKIDNALRAAIRAVVREHNDTLSSHSEYAAKRAAAAALLKLTRHALTLRRWRTLKAKADRLYAAAHAIEKNLGVNMSSFSEPTIADDKAFVAAGGILPKERGARLNAESIIARVAMATPAEGGRILRELKIRWEEVAS